MTIEKRVPLIDADNNVNSNAAESTRKNPFKDDKDDKDDNADCYNGCCSFMLFPVAIAAVVIASTYPFDSESSCSSTDYLIDTQLFLYVAGYLHIGWCAFRLLISCCSSSCYHEEKKQCEQCIDCPHFSIGIFNLVWAAIGLYIYNNQMSEECQNTKMGIMILSWSIIQYAFVLLLCICAVIGFCCCYEEASIEMDEAECNGKCKCHCKNNKGDERESNVGIESLV